MAILIDRVRVHNFRSLRDVEVSLAPMTLLVGMNNAGKTSFLKALHLALGGDRRVITREDVFALPEGEQESTEILIDCRIVPVDDNGERLEEFGESWETNDLASLVRFDSEQMPFVGIRTRIAFDSMRNDFEFKRLLLNDWVPRNDWITQPVPNTSAPRFENIVSFLIDAQRDLVGDLRSRTSYVGRLLSNLEISSEDAREIEEKLAELNNDIVSRSEVMTHLRDILEHLSKTVPASHGAVDVVPISKKLRDITKGVEVNFQDSDSSSFPLDYHGMGTRSWASLLTYKAYVSWLENQAANNRPPRPFHPILALEEPEAHLHPNAQRQLYQQLADATGQKIVSTHSPFVATQADLSSIRHFQKAGSETSVSELDVSEWDPEDVRKLAREVLNTRGELLFARAMILFEGETEEQALPIFASKYFCCDPFDFGLVFVGVGGDGKYLPFLRLAETLSIPWFIFSDGEEPAKEAVRNALEKIDVTLPSSAVEILPDGASIEKYLIDEGYRPELEEMLLEECANEYHQQAKKTELEDLSDEQILTEIQRAKTKWAPRWSRIISELDDDRRIPTAIKNVLGAIADNLSIEVSGGTS